MRVLVLAPLVLLLAGCAPKLERNSPEERVYRLVAPALDRGAALPASLAVLRPVVAPGLRTARIATVWPGNRLDYLAGAQWSGELGAVVQAAAVEALAASGRLAMVEAEPARFGTRYALGLEVRRFEADYTAATPPLARVTLAATVGRQSNRQALSTWTASAEVPAGANTMTGVTAALDEAFGRALADLLGQAQQAIAADLAGQPQSPPAR
jgi:ABC-type uncharacterized transport system auxiliary subunit